MIIVIIVIVRISMIIIVNVFIMCIIIMCIIIIIMIGSSSTCARAPIGPAERQLSEWAEMSTGRCY